MPSSNFYLGDWGKNNNNKESKSFIAFEMYIIKLGAYFLGYSLIAH